MKLPFGGCDLTDYFIKLVQKDGYIPTTTAEREIARNMKETLCTYPLMFSFDAKTFRMCLFNFGL
jgi:actin beta/gamma 1